MKIPNSLASALTINSRDNQTVEDWIHTVIGEDIDCKIKIIAASKHKNKTITKTHEGRNISSV